MISFDTADIFLLLCYSPALAGFGMQMQTGPAIPVVAGGPETLTPDSVTPAWSKNGAASNLETLTDSDDGTYFYTSTTSAGIQITMPDVVGGGAIASIQFCVRMLRTTTDTAPAVRLRLYNSSTYQSFSPDPITSTLATSFTDYCTTAMTTNPYTSAAWVTSDLNALIWFVNSGASTITPQQVQISKAWGVVNF